MIFLLISVFMEWKGVRDTFEWKEQITEEQYTSWDPLIWRCLSALWACAHTDIESLGVASQDHHRVTVVVSGWQT